MDWTTPLRLLRLQKSGAAAGEKRRRPQWRWNLRWRRPRPRLRFALLALGPRVAKPVDDLQAC
jgi:hypothetical protein